MSKPHILITRSLFTTHHTVSVTSEFLGPHTRSEPLKELKIGKNYSEKAVVRQSTPSMQRPPHYCSRDFTRRWGERASFPTRPSHL